MIVVVIRLKSHSTGRIFHTARLMAEGDQEDCDDAFLTDMQTDELYLVENAGRLQPIGQTPMIGYRDPKQFEQSMNEALRTTSLRYTGIDYSIKNGVRYKFDVQWKEQSWQDGTNAAYIDIFDPQSSAFIVKEMDYERFLQGGGKMRRVNCQV